MHPRDDERAAGEDRNGERRGARSASSRRPKAGAGEEYDAVVGALLVAHGLAENDGARRHVGRALDLLLPGGFDE